MKKKDKVKPLPPGTYTGTMEKIRKVRNKPYYRMTLNVQGHKIISILPFEPEKDDGNKD